MNNTVQMTEGDMVVITGRNFHGLMDAEVKASSLKAEWSGGSCLGWIGQKIRETNGFLGAGFKYFLFSPIVGEMIQVE